MSNKPGHMHPVMGDMHAQKVQEPIIMVSGESFIHYMIYRTYNVRCAEVESDCTGDLRCR